MVKINKRPAPPAPIKCENDYRSDPNFTAIAEDCYKKCYICENKSTTLNVEHLRPHKNNSSLKYDWKNLFLSCGHCNNVKLAIFDNIIDPSVLDPEECIALSLQANDSLIEEIVIETLSNDESVLQTANLLDRVYNNGTTTIKELESANLRNDISKAIATFRKYIEGYRNDPGYAAIIAEEISRSSTFAAFKRKIIRDDAELSTIFASSLT